MSRRKLPPRYHHRCNRTNGDRPSTLRKKTHLPNPIHAPTPTPGAQTSRSSPLSGVFAAPGENLTNISKQCYFVIRFLMPTNSPNCVPCFFWPRPKNRQCALARKIVNATQIRTEGCQHDANSHRRWPPRHNFAQKNATATPTSLQPRQIRQTRERRKTGPFSQPSPCTPYHAASTSSEAFAALGGNTLQKSENNNWFCHAMFDADTIPKFRSVLLLAVPDKSTMRTCLEKCHHDKDSHRKLPPRHKFVQRNATATSSPLQSHQRRKTLEKAQSGPFRFQPSHCTPSHAGSTNSGVSAPLRKNATHKS